MKTGTVSKICGAIILTLALCTAAYPQTILSRLLEDLSRYIGAAARLTANVVDGIDKVQAAEIPRTERPQASEELRRISSELLRLKGFCVILVDNISEYTSRAQQQGFSSEKQAYQWRTILSDVEKHSRFVTSTLDTVETGKWLKVVLEARDRMELRSMLIGRTGLLGRIRELPAPRTAQEIEQLDRLNQHYRKLVDSLDTLNISLTRAIDRLKLE